MLLWGTLAVCFSSFGWGVTGQTAVRLEPGELPLISVYASQNGAREVVVGQRQTPEVFQYRISPTKTGSQYPPWVDDSLIEAMTPRGVTCASILSNSFIRFRSRMEVITQVPFIPVPLEQAWAPANTHFKTDKPGIQRNMLSPTCDATNRCLVFEKGEVWVLEIVTPSWGVDEIVVVRGGANQGGGTNDVVNIKRDPGLWPVMRIPCLYCPLKSCITNCSNGEYATGFADSSVSHHRFFFSVTSRWLTRGGAADRDPVEPRRVQVLPRWNMEYVQG